MNLEQVKEFINQVHWGTLATPGIPFNNFTFCPLSFNFFIVPAGRNYKIERMHFFSKNEQF